MKILVIIGSIAKNSINKKLFELITPLAPKDFQFDSYDISLLPFYSQDVELAPPESVLKFQEKVIASDGVVFITPEYNRSIPGILKNAIDWCSSPYGASACNKKSVAVLGASIGAIGTFGAQTGLRKILSFLGCNVMYQPEIYMNFSAYMDPKGRLVDSAKQLYENFFISFHDHILRNDAV